MAELKRKGEAGVRELRLALDSRTDFKEVVGILERVLTIKDLPGIKGCAPCLSGLEKLVIEDLMF
ncbi:MAG TPA: hypothetical protein VNM67_04775 [Thermoanaerobaculia bacterium]|jgi:hypothetical protein|nr:hypothetical protein [Thermoanaerobaculia bacterium]